MMPRAAINLPGMMRPAAINKDRMFRLLVITGSILLLFSLAVWQIVSPESMDRWAREDGPFENVTAIFYGAAAVVFGILARRGLFPKTSTRGWGHAFLVAWALGAFFIMGEEISWGQRIFGLETPDTIKALNIQDEFNIHNLEFVVDNFYVINAKIFYASTHSALMLLVGVILPLTVLSGWGRRLIQRFAFPVVPACYSVLFLGALFYGKYLTHFAIDPNSSYELREFMWSLGILLFAVHGLVRSCDLYRLQPSECRSTNRE